MRNASRNLHHEADKILPSVGVGAMVIRDNRVLLGKRIGDHGAGSYAWCGGGLEFGESLEGAAKRELLEESGLVAAHLSFLCVSNVRKYGRHYIDFEFLVEALGEPEVKEPDKVEFWDWYDLDALPSPIFKPVEIAINSYRSGVLYNP
ncbi:NUDIX hydrolase [Streptomyces sp. IB201691-2A2]|uniref:nucleotide triphosphate diphosphatase NUDT15 n=1 Tax=Streptomyces sp. IB201691-2A2 TaxID=2561920 RepID=UPI00118085D2|nr:NUDIX domain-containing protein [Streptomyces sp. IB201691-2A2]TRO56122.1 NUDIX domain-containing protein [Streptomyces sp. IB201691-2A2]